MKVIMIMKMKKVNSLHIKSFFLIQQNKIMIWMNY